MLAADDDRRRIERELHDGVQQHLVALAVNLQLASGLTEADPAAAKALLDEMKHDVQRALEEAARLAQRIHPPLLEASSLAASLRAAASSAGVTSSVEVTTRDLPARGRDDGLAGAGSRRLPRDRRHARDDRRP